MRGGVRDTYVLATRRMTGSERARLGLKDVLLWDTERPYHYARWTPDRRLRLGGNDRPAVSPSRRKKASAVSTTQLRDYFDALLPALEDVETEYAWEGLFATTPDGLPTSGGIAVTRDTCSHWATAATG